jgi:hypothetical protein
LQINIAREGGKQVNVQGDVNGQKATFSAEGELTGGQKSAAPQASSKPVPTGRRLLAAKC